MKKPNKASVLIMAIVFAMILGAAAVHSKGNDKIKFSHNTHKDLGCADCHKDVGKDTGMFSVPPGKAVCAECHEVKKECDMCHSDFTAAKHWPKKKRKTNFLHSFHKDEISDCSMCHGDMDKKPYSPGAHKLCGNCHKEDIDNLLCAKCHRELAAAGLNSLNSFKHAENFKTEHKLYARRNIKTCTQCHAESFCNDCHSKKSGLKPSFKYPEAVKRNFIHRGDWLTLHRIEARTDEGSCLKCHAQKSCADCHEKYGAAPSFNASFGKHPAGWMAKGSEQFHGEQARRNITACASCHSKPGPGDCTTCHQKINPHPPGWEGKVKGMDKKDRMCAKCHNK